MEFIQVEIGNVVTVIGATEQVFSVKSLMKH